MSSNPTLGAATGPPARSGGTPAHATTAIDAAQPSNPFQVDLVIPFSIASGEGDRAQEQTEIRDGYEVLLRALEAEGGLKIASRPGRAGKGKEEVWVFVRAGEDKVSELVEREK